MPVTRQQRFWHVLVVSVEYVRKAALHLKAAAQLRVDPLTTLELCFLLSDHWQRVLVESALPLQSLIPKRIDDLAII